MILEFKFSPGEIVYSPTQLFSTSFLQVRQGVVNYITVDIQRKIVYAVRFSGGETVSVGESVLYKTREECLSSCDIYKDEQA